MNEPISFRAGDTVTWSEVFGIYTPSAGWTMKYTLSGLGGTLSVSSVSTSGVYVMMMTAAQTSVLASGTYTLAQCVESGIGAGLQRVTLRASNVDVLQNLSVALTTDMRSHLQRVFESIKAVIEKRATNADEEITIAGRSLRRTPHGELLKLYHQYEYMVAQEKQRERIANGLPAGNKVLTAFR